MNIEDYIFNSDNKYPPIIMKGTAVSPAAKSVLCTGVPAGARFAIFGKQNVFIGGVMTTTIERTYGFIDTSGNLINSYAKSEIYWRVYGY